MEQLNDLFKISSLVQFIMESEGFQPSEFLSKTFFPASTSIMGEDIVMDIFKGSRPVAPFVTEVSEGINVRRKGYETKTVKPPNITTYMPTTASDIFRRNPGEIPFQGGKTGLDLAEERIGMDLEYQMKMHRRAIEVMASQALFDGKVTISGPEVDQIVTFGRDPSHEYELLGTSAWNDYSGSDPIFDLREWKNQIREDEGLDADNVLMSESVLKYFINHPKVKDNLTDKDGAKISGIAELLFDYRQNGVDYVGRVCGMNIWTYNNWYEDSLGASKPLVPEDTVLVAVSGERSDNATHFGAVYDLDASDEGLPNPLEVPMFSKVWKNPNPSALYVMVKSRPLVVSKRPNSTVKAKVLDLP